VADFTLHVATAKRSLSERARRLSGVDTDGPGSEQGTLGTESEWLFHCEFEVQGTRLQVLERVMAVTTVRASFSRFRRESMSSRHE